MISYTYASHIEDGIRNGPWTNGLYFQVICSVVGHYVDKVSEHLPDSVGELEQVHMYANATSTFIVICYSVALSGKSV